MRTRRTKSSSNPVPSNGHQSVLLHEAIESLHILPSSVIVDATLGGAGHAKEIASHLGKEGILVGIDADDDAIERAKQALKGEKATIRLCKDNFRNLERILNSEGIEKVDGFLFDLGWSAYHLNVGRGFTFSKDEPLVMTYQKDISKDTLTAEIIVNTWREESLADIFWGWGEEKFSRKIAKAIIKERSEKPIKTTGDLVDIISKAVPSWYRHRKIHPATKVFQALRIAVNDELGAIETALKISVEKLSTNGRIAVITFHSIEDRLIKQVFRSWKEEKKGIPWKLIKPSKEEVQNNPRARSAKLRVFEKTNN